MATGIPYATVPLGLYSNRRSFCLGFVVRMFDDELLMRIMAAFENTFPARLVPPIFEYKSVVDRSRYHLRRATPYLKHLLWP